jgi:hypothetical protein
MDRPKFREAVYIALILAYIVVQVVIPLTQLPYRFHTPLGWKMFAYYGPVPVDFRLIHADGRTEELTARAAFRTVRTLRPEVNRAQAVPPVLCSRYSLSAVEYRKGAEDEWRRIPCSEALARN